MARKKLQTDKEIEKPKLVDSTANNGDALEPLREISMLVGGKNAGQIVDLLIGKKHINEFIIAKKLELTINQTRNILYKLADEALVSSIRKKDKKKGWYTYFWIFNVDKAYLLLKKNMVKELGQLEHQLKSREVKQFYICKTCNSEITEENALLHDFTCLECGEVYEVKDNTQIISEMKSSILRIKKKIASVNIEISAIEEKRVKKLEREKRKLEKEKIAKRKKAAEARRKAKKKEEKKNPKKKVKKKTKKKPKKKSSKKTKKGNKKTSKKKINKKPNKKLAKKSARSKPNKKVKNKKRR